MRKNRFMRPASVARGVWPPLRSIRRSRQAPAGRSRLAQRSKRAVGRHDPVLVRNGGATEHVARTLAILLPHGLLDIGEFVVPTYRTVVHVEPLEPVNKAAKAHVGASHRQAPPLPSQHPDETRTLRHGDAPQVLEGECTPVAKLPKCIEILWPADVVRDMGIGEMFELRLSPCDQHILDRADKREHGLGSFVPGN